MSPPFFSSSADSGSSIVGATVGHPGRRHRRAEPEGLRRVDERQPDAAGAGRTVGLRRDLAQLGLGLDRRQRLQDDLEGRADREVAGQLVGNVDHRLAQIRARHGDDRLAGRNRLADLGADGGDDAVEIREQPGIAELFLRSWQARPWPARHWPRPPCARLLRGIEDGLRGVVGGKQLALALLAGGGVGELRLGVGEIGLGRLHGQLQRRRIERGDRRALADDVADLDVARDDPAEQAEGKVGAELRLDRAGKTEGLGWCAARPPPTAPAG